ncbi:MAG TPA: glycoside hydrolase family 36 protein, partial [Candidatus Lokiarchaeia archaeon]|nr:glycoside hydrolase family 36 protein [Candidatus Lokiarchaeia archaeon]
MPHGNKSSAPAGIIIMGLAQDIVMAEISTRDLTVQVHLTEGTWDVASNVKGRIVVQNAFATIATGNKCRYATVGMPITAISGPYTSGLGDGTRWCLDFDGSAEESPVHLQLFVVQYDGRPIVTVEAIATNISPETISVSALSPLAVDAHHVGGLFCGSSPDDALVFENGFTHAEEFFLRSFAAREESDSQWMEFVYAKADVSENILVGVIDMPRDLCHVVSNEDLDHGLDVDGREGIAQWRAEVHMPFPKPLPPGDSISSGVWAVMIDAFSGFDALESYANLIREYNHIQVWPGPIPHGWNSWNNPLKDFPGAYVTKINEDIILENMVVAVQQLKPFGLHYWQLDAGYTPDRAMTVDEVDEDRFPHGMKWLADQIHAQGLKAGIWFNPFNVGKESRLFREHEADGWFPEPDPSFPIHSRWRSLDLTRPDVQQYFRHAVRKVTKEWGFDLLKVDFSYFALAPSKFFDAVATAPEALRLGHHILREEAGPGVFIASIGGPIGLHWGDVDGERISLDTLPQWGEEHDLGVNKNGVVVSYRTFARRYFLQNRVWINHLDCLCFRPPMATNESLCLATAMAMFGGLFKIGDKLVEMAPESFAVVQKMLPVYREGARPLDLFRTLIPEILHLAVQRPFLTWHVVATFNWGVNTNLLTGDRVPEGPKEVLVEFSELGVSSGTPCHVFDFWSETYLGVFENLFTSSLEPRHVQLLAIHPVDPATRPQFLSSNRHITQGGVELSNLCWDPDSMVLSGTLSAVANFSHRLFFHVPPTYVVS